MIADSLIYLKEYNEITAKNRNEKNFDTSDEFLSGLQKSDRLHPVISLCIYYGKEDMRMSLPGKLNFEIHKKKLLFLHIKITI